MSTGEKSPAPRLAAATIAARVAGRAATRGLTVSDEFGHSPEVTQWLREVAQRACQPVEEGLESSETVLAYLESAIDRPLRSRTAVDRYLDDLLKSEADRALQSDRRRTRRELALLAFLAAAYLHYLFWDVQLQIAALPQTYFFAPVKARGG